MADIDLKDSSDQSFTSEAESSHSSQKKELLKLDLQKSASASQVSQKSGLTQVSKKIFNEEGSSSMDKSEKVLHTYSRSQLKILNTTIFFLTFHDRIL